jgi:phosphoesterase RecJ-like protein
MPNELTPKQQWNELVKNAKSILVLAHHHPDGDALGSMLALKAALEKLDKEVTVAVSGNIPQFLSFLPGYDTLQKDPSFQKDLLIVIDETQAKIGNITLKRVSDTKLMVVVTPKDGALTPANVRVEDGSFTTDLVIVLDSPELERLGAIYEENSSLFFEVPVVNIDHHPGNTNFGKVNIVDITASSTAEILVSLIETVGKDMPGIIDEPVATALLTGLLSDTSSFQNANTTPKSLTVAAQLVAAGARQQDIVRHIFKTRTLSQLRLWGRALSYIKEDAQLKFAWSILTKADFVAAQADEAGGSGVIDELLKTAAGMEFVLLLSERDNGVHGSLRSIVPSMDVSRLANAFGGGGHPQAAAFTMENASLKDKEMEIVNKIRNVLRGGSGEQQPSQKNQPPKPQKPKDPGVTLPIPKDSDSSSEAA